MSFAPSCFNGSGTACGDRQSEKSSIINGNKLGNGLNELGNFKSNHSEHDGIRNKRDVISKESTRTMSEREPNKRKPTTINNNNIVITINKNYPNQLGI